MTPTALFGLIFGPVAVASVIGLLGDMFGQRWAGRIGTALLLAAAGSVSLVAGLPLKPALVYDTFMVGRGYSTITGLALVLASLVLFASSDNEGSVPALVALSAGGAVLAATAADLVALLVGLEIAAMCGYALVSTARSRRSDEAAMKYFVQGAVATGLFVLGLAVLVGATGGTANTAAVARTFGMLGIGQPLLLGVMSMVAALSFKSGVAPFHSWAPDAYENAPSSVSGLLAGAVKLAMVTALSVFAASMTQAGMGEAAPFGLVGMELVTTLGVLAVISVVLGSTVALRTASYARMLGYAGVAQVGYALIAITALQPTLAVLFMATYAVGATGAFVAAEVFKRRRPEWDGTIAGLAGFGRTEPATAAALTVLLMSLAGIPPLVGFWGKLQVFGAAIGRASQIFEGGLPGLGTWLALLSLVGLVGSVVSLGYYGSVIRALYFDAQPAGDSDTAIDARAPRAVAVFMALAAVLLGLVPLLFGVSATVRAFLLG